MTFRGRCDTTLWGTVCKVRSHTPEKHFSNYVCELRGLHFHTKKNQTQHLKPRIPEATVKLSPLSIIVYSPSIQTSRHTSAIIDANMVLSHATDLSTFCMQPRLPETTVIVALLYALCRVRCDSYHLKQERSNIVLGCGPLIQMFCLICVNPR